MVPALLGFVMLSDCAVRDQMSHPCLERQVQQCSLRCQPARWSSTVPCEFQMQFITFIIYLSGRSLSPLLFLSG